MMNVMNIDNNLQVQPLTSTIVGCPIPPSLVHYFWETMGPSLARSKKTKICSICSKVCDTQGFATHE